ncbi:hypothetical protein H5410_056600 [Solanum commersonii]|uniref:Uncharacterized protein n=1 Tax=Solanum commersonii TaxID=4109 RepID=A0A9J5WLS4_SOLCO|nr:hypothetical protein H5410_056600 [Solanum commersonii]
MEQVVPDGKTDPFSRLNNLRSRRREDLSYGPDCSRRENWPIFMVKRSPNLVNPPFCRFSCAIVHRSFDLSYGVDWSRWVNQPIFKVKRAPKQSRRANRPIFKVKRAPEQFFENIRQNLSFGADWSRLENRPIFKVNQSLERTSVKTLVIDSVGPDRETLPIFKVKQSPKWTLAMEPDGPIQTTGLFSMSNEPQNRFPPSFLPKYFLDVREDLSYGAGWSRLENRPILHGQMIPEADHGSFGDPKFRRHFCQTFSWTSVKTLALEPIGPDG